jgi:putative membrane protein
VKKYIVLFFKGLAMGVGNIIPGVSGGTIALITGIFERFIYALKSYNLSAFKMLYKGNWKGFVLQTDFYFLISVGLGMLTALLSLAKAFEYLFLHYPVFIWSFFFGLILASIYYVIIMVEKWSFSSIFSLIFGIISGVIFLFINPASPNDNIFFLFISGAISIVGMILPGLSGSFLLVLMGNYELTMIDGISTMNIRILLPFVLGAIAGLVGFSYILAYVYKRYKNQTLALIAGFIIGSLIVIWPWKKFFYKLDSEGNILHNSDGMPVVLRYLPKIPEQFNNEVIIAIIFAITGIFLIWLTEYLAAHKPLK